MSAKKTYFKQIPVEVVSKIAKLDVPKKAAKGNGIKKVNKRS